LVLGDVDGVGVLVFYFPDYPVGRSNGDFHVSGFDR
jgi:hypothetical protein